MKNYEEDYKKKYEEALKRAKIELSADTTQGTKNVLMTVFPELKENEDERIRKKLIEAVKGDMVVGGTKDKQLAIAWLEKQGEQKPVEWSEEDKKIKNALIDYFDNANKSDENPLMQYGIQTDKVITWLEKQGEQKSTHNLTSQEAMDIAVAKCFDEQKPADKVEPKFHEGEWIACGGLNTAKIVNIEGNKYEVELIDGNKVFPNIDYVDRLFHLWTIKDAEDGDVLLSKHNQPFIYNGIFDKENVGAYCGIDMLGDEFLKGIFSCIWFYKDGVKPATKEQHNFLFSKMKEAGYEWDKEEKELKKIENEIEIPFGVKDSELQEVTYYIPKGFHAEIDDDMVVIKKGEKPIAWNEEDERIRKELIAFLKENHETGRADKTWSLSGIERWIAWLEKLSEQKPKDKYTFKSIPRLLEMIKPTGRAKAYCQKLIDSLLQEGYVTDAKIVSGCLKQMNGEEVAMATMDEQKSIDKAEPKFKVGDWVVDEDNNCIHQIERVIENVTTGKFAYDLVKGGYFPSTKKNYHLWTIADAKDGDVIVAPYIDDIASSEKVFIFKGIRDREYANNVVEYYCYFANGRFYANEGMRCFMGYVYDYFTPATKEQRDTLMKAMKDAGYTFDKKALKNERTNR